MRNRERRIAEAITAYLARDGHDPDPRALARVIGEAAGATGCAIVIGERRHQWGDGDGPWREHHIGYGGVVPGVLAVTPESVGPLSAVAAVLGAPVEAIRLAEETDRLRRDGDAAARVLVDDRWRAAAEMEQERRGLERDLHDGAQHHLVSLRMSLALVEHAISKGAGRDRVADLVARLDEAERVLVDTATGILPGALVADGVAAALRTELARHDTVTLDSAGLRRRYPAPVESAVYFVVLEAVNNARKHAEGARVTVTVRDGYRGLEFTVADDGPGFAVAAPNAVLPNLAARAASVGGVVEVRSAPGAGTTVSGLVPF
ncbi:sensor histidine kinase [Saccharothrix sp. NRRL B-16348]|uniref:sensor histidine kinase n=1 Tax=Saccharothrix sp. NRRL B-16348 TaxID=1415542 RepID=UPI0006AE8BB2|nr:ATP-binding protein [Saccharothrix sp. NRRL B-16348]